MLINGWFFLLLSVLYTQKMGAIGYLNEQDIRNKNIDNISDKNYKGDIDITQEKIHNGDFQGQQIF